MIRGWARRRSLWVLPFGTTCCAADLGAAFAPGHDLGRFGVQWIHEPSLADVLVVAGRVTRSIEPILQHLYEAMPAPRRVIAFGSCACTGGAFDTEEVVGGADAVVPVDAYVPGCPPEPEVLHEALAGLARVPAGS